MQEGKGKLSYGGGLRAFVLFRSLLCVSKDVVRKILTSDASLRLFILFLFLTFLF